MKVPAAQDEFLFKQIDLGSACAGTTLVDVFEFRLKAKPDLDVFIGNFRSSCGCAITTSEWEFADECYVIKLRLSWNVPLSPLAASRNETVMNSVESIGSVTIGTERKVIKIGYCATVDCPFIVNCNQSDISKDGAEFLVTRNAMTEESFSELKLFVTQDLRLTEDFRSTDLILCTLSTQGQRRLTRSSVVLSDAQNEQTYPVYLQNRYKTPFKTNVVFAKCENGKCRARLLFEPFENTPPKKTWGADVGAVVDLDSEGFVLQFPDSALVDGQYRFITLHWEEPDGKFKSTDVKIWREQEHDNKLRQ